MVSFGDQRVAFVSMEQHEPQRDYQRYMVMAINGERAAQGLTIKGMAERAGIHERTMLRVLALERDLDFAQVDAIARALHVRVSDLVAEAERRQATMIPVRPDMSVVDEVLAEDTTLTPKQKASLREQAAESDTLSGHSHRERSHRKVL